MITRKGFLKVWRPFVVLVVLGALLVSYPADLAAATLRELMQQKRQLEREREILKKDASETKVKISSLEQAIVFLDRSIDLLSSQIKSTEGKIAETTDRIIAQEKEIGERKSERNEAIRLIYELGATDSLLEALLSNEDVSEAVNKFELMDALRDRLGEMIDIIGLIKADLEDKRSELVSLKQQQSEQKNALAARQAQKEKLLKNETVELSRLNRQMETNKDKIAAIEAQIAAEVALLWKRRDLIVGTGQRIKAGTAIGRLGSTGYSTGPHVHFECLRNGTPVNPRLCVPPLSWPLVEFSVSQEFGQPNWQAAYSWHTGIDLVAPYGTPVFASCSGEIIMRRWYGGYGNAVVIACDNGWWTLYGHMIN